MTPNEIEVLAHKNAPMPELSQLPEVCLYQAFANLYSRLNLRQLDRQQAMTEKKRILKAYAEMKSEYERYLDVCRNYQNNIRTVNARLPEINKAQTAEETALAACECIGLLTGDTEFLKLQKRKFLKE